MPVNRNIVFGAGYGKTDSWKDIDDWLRKNFSEFLKSEGERITQEDSKQLFEEAGPRAYMYEMFMKKLLSGAPFKPTFQSYRHFQASYVEGMKLSEICNGRTPKISPSGEICNVISMDESFVYNSARSSENEFK